MKWTFETQSRQRVGGVNLAEPNFTRESSNIVRLFCREFNQNVIDARGDDPRQPGKKRKAHITIKVLDKNSGLDIDYIKDLFSPLEKHLVAAEHGFETKEWDNPKVLVIEEFDTVGLTGAVNNSYAEGENERWSNFWFGEGKRSKSGTKLGRQGQGKITYHIVSGLRSIVALTRRHEEDQEYVFGKSILQKTHNVEGIHYTQHGYWPIIDNELQGQPIPETSNEFIKKFKKGFLLQRKNEPGTSWIIPMVPSRFSELSLLKEFVRDFFFSVLNDDITASIAGFEVDSGSIQKIFEFLKIESPSQSFFNFIVDSITSPPSAIVAKKGWEKGVAIREESFSPEELSKIKEDFRAGKLVSVQFPVSVRYKNKKEKDSKIEVFVRGGDFIRGVEEIYVRSGLVIADEQHLKKEAYQAFGMMMANDTPIAEFLGYCEVASHLLWNSREKEAKRIYDEDSIAQTLDSVRESLPKLYRLLAGGDEVVVKDAFDDILSIASVGGDGKKVVKPKPPKPPVPPKPPRPRKPELFIYSEVSGEWSIIPGKDAASFQFPVELTFQFAYDRLLDTGSPWASWHPFDFNFNDGILEYNTRNAGVNPASGNRITIKITSSDFFVRIHGFSKSQPLLSRVIDI
jgi:hypothetical protein